MIADQMLRSAHSTTSDKDVILGSWTIDPSRSRTVGRLATITALTNTEGAVDVTVDELAITAVFDVEHAEPSCDGERWSLSSPRETFPSGTLRARTILWSGEDGLAMGEVSLNGMTRTSAFDIVVQGYSADRFGDERARIAVETEMAVDGDTVGSIRCRLRLELDLVRVREPDPASSAG